MDGAVQSFTEATAAMRYTINTDEWRRMSPEERDLALGKLVEAAKSAPNGGLAELEAEVRAFEERHGLSTAAVKQALAEGRMLETWDICQWLFAAHRRDRLAGSAPRSH
jgi:hypothetical protein